MYRIDRQANRIKEVRRTNFSELGFKEREHLQEWLAHKPDALGEELLIIQKEFDGFDDTKERLDLLAIDKEGSLVIIENKLDDSGRNVVWQSLKYAAYCSTLSKTQIAEIYQSYLDKLQLGQSARALICEFLGKEEFEEVTLNHGVNQRLIMVAAEFRKEVTSAVLWLLKHNVMVKCFKAVPYEDGANLFLTIEQLIPLPEAEELMIGISEKEVEEQAVERGEATRHHLRSEFWQKMLDALDKNGVKLYANVTPSKDHWLNAGSGLSGVHYSMIFSKFEARMCFVLGRSSKEENKALFDMLYSRAAEFENIYGMALSWRRVDDKKVSIIEVAHPFDGYEKNSWSAMIEWLVEHVQRMHKVFGAEIPSLKTKLKLIQGSSALWAPPPGVELGV